MFCFVMLCMDVFLCILYAYIFMYMCIFMCVYTCMCVCVHICLCLMCCYIYTLFYLYKSYLFKCLSCRWRDLGCYLLVWHCYLGSILAFSFEFQNLNTTICTKTSNNRDVSRARSFATGPYWYGIRNSYPKSIKLKMLKEC